MEVPHPLAQSCQVQEEEHEQPQEQLEPERNETNTTSTTVPLDNASPTLEATSGDPPSPTSTVSSQTTRVEQLSIQPPPLAAMTLSLGSLSNFHPQRQLPVFNPADAPPPYSPTHTILPHYFSLVPIPIRSYTIKESHSLPSLLDFWLHTTSSLTRPSSPTGERLQLQERGLPPQTGGPELKYSLIRPTQSDRTAIPPGHPSFTQHNFIPPWALIRADMPGRWLWWGTEALHLVVFGRQLKNVYMEWRWRRGRTRIGGPIVTRLIGCSFRITPDRGYCWRQGTGRATNLTMATPPPSSSRSRAQRRRHAMTATRQRSTEHTVVDIGNGENTSPQDISVASGQRNASATSFTATMGSFFSRFMRSSNQPETTNTTAVSVTALVAAPSLPSAPPLATAFSTAASSGTAADIEMHTMPSNIAFNNQVQETVPFSERISGHATPGSIDSALIAHPLDDTGSRAPPNMGEEGHRRSETLVPSTQFTTHDSVHDNSYPHMDEGEGNEDISHDSDDDDDDDAGVYHCREESIDGVPGRLVAVYRPARAANRARDLPARSCKLEIYAEIGERCETVLMFMCTRLDDLFMSIPESKRMPVRSRRREHQRRHRSHGAHGE
ncbi:hypothetical protein BGW41_000219 [Actinomortierella wolfii]|nr:hypothetical protein BGW41_000219 [Actinomortierella wolfii]